MFHRSTFQVFVTVESTTTPMTRDNGKGAICRWVFRIKPSKSFDQFSFDILLSILFNGISKVDGVDGH